MPGDARPDLAPATAQARQLAALYRLTRHDALAGLGEALRAFMGAGGTEALGQGGTREGRAAGRGGAHGRLRLGAQQQSELFVFRDVALQGLEDDCVRVGGEGVGRDGGERSAGGIPRGGATWRDLVSRPWTARDLTVALKSRGFPEATAPAAPAGNV